MDNRAFNAHRSCRCHGLENDQGGKRRQVFQWVKPSNRRSAITAKDFSTSSCSEKYLSGCSPCFTFRTHDNTLGVYQINGLDNDGIRGVWMRYKLVADAADAPAAPENNNAENKAPEKAELPWGDWNSNWSVRLRTARTVWGVDELPEFTIDLRRREVTDGGVAIRRTLHNWILEVDGRRFRLGVVTTSWEKNFLFKRAKPPRTPSRPSDFNAMKRDCIFAPEKTAIGSIPIRWTRSEKTGR